MAARKPKPRIVSEVCDLCGLDWQLHGDEATTATCIRLLAAEVRRLESALAARPTFYPIGYPQPYPVPYRPWTLPYPSYPWSGTARPINIYSQVSATSHTPAMSSARPQAMLTAGGTT